jgi:hypothetical protein
VNHSMRDVRRLSILTVSGSGFKHRLAAAELRRGLLQLGYVGSTVVGELPGPREQSDELRFVLTAGDDDAESYEVSAERDGGGVTTVTITGAGEQALLYAVFDFLERQGAYYGLDGDLYPLDLPDTLRLPDRGNPWRSSPRFATRGLLPWPDFLNCITVFNREDHRAYLEAMLRMRFNTLGIHVYGQRDKWAESFLSFEYGGVGHTALTDTTATDRWGYLPQRTSRYGMGAAQYFDGDVFGSDATRQARSPWEAAELAQALWREAFAYAEKLGIRTGVGFEPNQLPDEIRRATPPEVRIERKYNFRGREFTFATLDPGSRAAKDILENRLNQLLEAYPSVNYVWLWEDEFTNWASQREDVPIPATPFKQAHDFLRRHAPDKRLVLAGWGGVVRHFEGFHRELPEDVVFTALSDQFGWDPVNEAFGELEDRERWPIPWLEDDPSMWFPQLHVGRFAKDLNLAERYGCQGVLGIHWRHRIVDPNAGYLARRSWQADLEPAAHYGAYARTQAAEQQATAFANLLQDAEQNRRLLSTWTGETGPDGHAITQEFSGDYSEAFNVEADFEYTDESAPLEIPDETVDEQAKVIARLGDLAGITASAPKRDRLGYWYGQMRFLDPYARAWQTGRRLHKLLDEQRTRKHRGEVAEASAHIREHGVPLWVTLIGQVREAVLAFQRTVATRNDLGMLASIHNKFVRIVAFRMRASLLEFLDELPAEADAAHAAALALDGGLEADVFVPTRPTRLEPGEQVRITAVAPGMREPCDVALVWRRIGTSSWERRRMHSVGRRTYAADMEMPADAEVGVEYYVEAAFAGNPRPLIATAPPDGPGRGYLVTA